MSKYESIANLQVHCKNAEEWKAVVGAIESFGDGVSGLEEYQSRWPVLHTEKCVEDASNSSVNYCERHNLNIINYEQFQSKFFNCCVTDALIDLNQDTSHSPSESNKVVSDGGSSKYYEIVITNKAGESIKVEMGDIIRACVANDFDLGNIMKACRRISEAKQGRGKAGASVEYDANKIVYFANEVKFWSK